MNQGNTKIAVNARSRRTAISTCIKCGGQKFEIALTQQTGSASRLSLVQCASCGTPTEVIDPDLPIRANWFERLIISIDNKLAALAKTLTDSN
jgi:transcription elongation factor Elf1